VNAFVCFSFSRGWPLLLSFFLPLLLFSDSSFAPTMPPDADKLRQRKTVAAEEELDAAAVHQQRICSLKNLKGTEVCIDGNIYDISNFDHPGGESILVFGGNDVTVQYRMIHPYHTSKHLEKMTRVGKVADFECE
jgi:fatty acid desaturase (delta-4 desaturase)